jgi:hypothetical protein
MLTHIPLVCTNPPEKIREPAIGSLGAAGGGLRRNPASSSAGTGRAWAEGELQTPRCPFRDSVVEGEDRRGGCAGGQRLWPPRPAVPARWGVWGEDGTPASSVRCKGRWEKCLFGLPAGRPWSSPRLPSMAPAAARPWAWRGVRRAVPLLWAAREPVRDHKGPTATSRNTR